MLKKNLRFGIIVLLLLCVIAVPLFGFNLYDSPSIFDENAIFTNRQFGGGTTVYLAASEDSAEDITAEDYENSATILKERFLAMGYSDVETAVEDDMVRIDISQKTFVDSVISQASAPGDWQFVGSNLSDVICDGSLVKDASVVSNSTGGYGIKIVFNEGGADKFMENAASYAASSSYIYLMVDGQFTASATVPTSVKDSFTFGAYEQSSASTLATYIKYGKLPASFEIEKTEALAPTVPMSVQIAIYAVCAIVILALIVILIVSGKFAGLFGAFVLIADVAVMAAAVVNGSFMFNISTLITMMVLLVLSALLIRQTVAPIGTLIKSNKKVSAGFKGLSKNALRVTWTHALLLAITILCLFFISGPAIYVVRCAMVFATADFLLYFALVYFGIYTLAE